MGISHIADSTYRLTVPDGSIAFELHGDAGSPLVVALPGMGDTRHAYRELALHLAAAGYRVAALDTRGHGESSVGWTDVTQAAIGRDAAALIQELGVPAAVIGHSFTPDSAVAAALLTPELVRAVIAIAPWASAPRQNWAMRQAMRFVTTLPWAWGWFMNSLYAVRTPATALHRANAVRALKRREGTVALQKMADPKAKDAMDLRQKLAVPALVIMGAKDPDFGNPRAEAEAYASGFANDPDVIVVEDTGHYPHVEQPDQVAGAIVRFLAESGIPGAPRA